MKEEKELSLFPDKVGNVYDLLVEAKKHVTLEPGGSGKLRLMDILSNKIVSVQKEDIPLEIFNFAASNKTYR